MFTLIKVKEYKRKQRTKSEQRNFYMKSTTTKRMDALSPWKVKEKNRGVHDFLLKKKRKIILFYFFLLLKIKYF